MKTTMKAVYLSLGALGVFLFGSVATHADTFYVSNYGDNTIEKFDSAGNASLFASSGLNGPTGLAFDSRGSLYVGNRESNTIEKFSPTGDDLGVFANTGLNSPYFIAIQPALGFAGFLAPIGGADATGGSFARPLRTFKM